LLWIFGMSFFDAINHSFATIATGGFSTKNLSIASFDNIRIEITIMVFMVLSGIHFGLIFGTLTLKKPNIFSSGLVKTFLLLLVIGIVLVSTKLYTSGFYDLGNAVRYASFQVISLGTTTGFATVDTANWPIFTIIVLIYFTIQCAMTGSTSGGLKFDRVFIFFKIAAKEMKLLKHPRGVYVVKVDDITIDEKMEYQTLVFIVLYVVTFFVTTIALTTIDIDGMTALSASVTTIGNVGPGFEKVSSLGNFGQLPDMAKYLLSINMLLGRLEIFNVFALLLVRK